MRRIKLIWDFRGPDAEKIAEHHEIHLKDYIQTLHVNNSLTGIESISNMHTIAFMVVDEKDMKPIREVLKPPRGQVYSEPKP